MKNDKLMNTETKQSITKFIHYCNKYITLNEKDNLEISYEIKNLEKDNVYSKEWLLEMYSHLLTKQKAVNH